LLLGLIKCIPIGSFEIFNAIVDNDKLIAVEISKYCTITLKTFDERAFKLMNTIENDKSICINR